MYAYLVSLQLLLVFKVYYYMNLFINLNGYNVIGSKVENSDGRVRPFSGGDLFCSYPSIFALRVVVLLATCRWPERLQRYKPRRYRVSEFWAAETTSVASMEDRTYSI